MIISTITRSIAVLAAVAAVSVTGMTGVASAALRTPTPSIGTKTTTVATPPSVVYDKKHQEVGEGFSAGIAGYDDATCEQLAIDYDYQVELQDSAQTDAAAENASNNADQLYGQLTDNCGVID